MNTLATTIEDPLFRYEQIVRHGMFAMYTQTHKTSGTIRYEVIHIRTHKGHVWPNGTITEAGEAYPTARMWGAFAKTFFTLADAQAYLTELMRAQEVAAV